MSPTQGFYNYVEYDDGILKSYGFNVSGADTTQIWEQRKLEILSYKELEENWDGEGAPAFREELVFSAVLFLSELRDKLGKYPPNRVIPSQDGEIVFEWQGEGYFIEACISQPYRVEWMLDIDGRVNHYEASWNTQASRDEKPTVLWQQYEAA